MASSQDDDDDAPELTRHSSSIHDQVEDDPIATEPVVQVLSVKKVSNTNGVDRFRYASFAFESERSVSWEEVREENGWGEELGARGKTGD